jgi:hypothetical protein
MFNHLWKSLLRLCRPKNGPRPCKSITRWAYLDVQILEKRELFSAYATLVHPLFPAGDMSKFDQDPWNAPNETEFSPLNFITNALVVGPSVNSLTTSGTFSFDLTGSYSAFIHEAGGNAQDSFTFNAAATVVYWWHYDGSFLDTQNWFTNASGYYNATDTWNYTHSWNYGSNGSGANGSNSGTEYKSGTDVFSGEQNSDYFHWYGTQWAPLVSMPASLHQLSLCPLGNACRFSAPNR